MRFFVRHFAILLVAFGPSALWPQEPISAELSKLNAALEKLKSSYPEPVVAPSFLDVLLTQEQKILSFQKYDLESYKDELFLLCSDLEDEDAQINLQVAKDPKTKKSGPTKEQKSRKLAIASARRFCATEGSGVKRDKRFWIEYARYFDRAMNDLSILRKRINSCEAEARCRKRIVEG
jgi:hypothetical protein